MDEFHQAAELVMFATGIAAETGREQEKEGPDSLAAAIEDVGGDGIDEGDAGIEVLVGPGLRPPPAHHDRRPRRPPSYESWR